MSRVANPTSTTSSPPCVICGGVVRPRSENGFFPFCQQRCQQIDLGNWLGETYRVPAEPAEVLEHEDDEPTSPGPR